MSNTQNTVPVHIRTSEDVSATYLCHWPVGELNGLIRTLDSWGYADQHGNTEGEALGQFRIGDGAAYFEIVVAQDGE